MRRHGILGLVSISFSLALLCSSTGCNKMGPTEADAPPGGDTRTGFERSESRRSESPSDGWSRDARKSADFAGDAVAGTARPAPVSEEAMGTRWDDGDVASPGSIAREREPGLGTAYGESRSSSVDTVSFRRADPSTPDVVFSIHYDDVGGVREVARSQRTRAFSDTAMSRQGDLSFALIDDNGRVLSAASVGSQLYAVGEPESRYSLALANDSNTTYEVVLSVDGLDVIDGRPAGFDKRGYVIDPFTSVVIDGWRTSEDTVAAFRFSSIEDSYAERTGEGRNVGVIGAAFFREAPRQWEEWRAPEDTWRRETADPFPGNR